MSVRVGFVTGSLPFAGLQDNPAEEVLKGLDGTSVGGIAIRTFATPPILAELPERLPALIAEHRPAFVLSLGLATGSAVLRLETTAINRLAFATPDNVGVRPTDGRPIEQAGPAARLATWDARGLARDLLAADLPATVSYFAGTHLCNGTLYTVLGAMEANGLSGPAGFLHLPYSPRQVARFMRESPAAGDMAPMTPRDLPSMSLADQARALSIVLAGLAAQASP